MVAGVNGKVTKGMRSQWRSNKPKREARLPGSTITTTRNLLNSTITTTKNLLNITTVATPDALVTSLKGNKGTTGKIKAPKLPINALSTDFIVAVGVTLVLLALLFWILVLLWERRRRNRKWEDYKIYEQERQEYKRQMKLRRKRIKKLKKKGEFAKKGGRIHVPTELHRNKREDKTSPGEKGSRAEDRLEKASGSKEEVSRHSKENESRQSTEKREESVGPANVNEIEQAIKGGKMSLASFEKEAPETNMKGEMASMTAKEEEEAPGEREEMPEKKPADPEDKRLREEYSY